jgi:hypothetical protein
MAQTPTARQPGNRVKDATPAVGEETTKTYAKAQDCAHFQPEG